MLNDIEKQEIEKEIATAPMSQAACIGALKIIQSHRGYVSDEALRDLSAVLGMSTADLDGIATFYSRIFRKPVGRHVIFVCDSISCWLTGEDRILDYLQKKLGIQLGQTTKDGMFTLLPSACLGHCEQAPAMMLDDEIIGGLTEQRIDEILDKATRP